MKTLSPEQLYMHHDQLAALMVVLWIIFSYLGYKIQDLKHKQYISYSLIAFALLQEILDYTNRIFLDEAYVLSLRTDLPLHFCQFGFYFSLFGVFVAASNRNINPKIEQFIFDCAYVLGLAGALQAMITVDLTGINNQIGIYALNWQHSLIILNVLWLVFAYKKRFTVSGIFNAFIFINVIIWPVGLVNYFLGSNYMFVCQPPNVDSSFFIGEWPYYLFWLELIYFLYIVILYLPFKIIDLISKKT